MVKQTLMLRVSYVLGDFTTCSISSLKEGQGVCSENLDEPLHSMLRGIANVSVFVSVVIRLIDLKSVRKSENVVKACSYICQ